MAMMNKLLSIYFLNLKKHLDKFYLLLYYLNYLKFLNLILKIYLKKFQVLFLHKDLQEKSLELIQYMYQNNMIVIQTQNVVYPKIIYNFNGIKITLFLIK